MVVYWMMILWLKQSDTWKLKQRCKMQNESNAKRNLPERSEMKRSEIYRNETERNKTNWNAHKNWKGMQFSETNILKRNKTEYVETYMPVPSPIWMTIGHINGCSCRRSCGWFFVSMFMWLSVNMDKNIVQKYLWLRINSSTLISTSVPFFDWYKTYSNDAICCKCTCQVNDLMNGKHAVSKVQWNHALYG